MGAIEPGHGCRLVQHRQLRERGVEQGVLRPDVGLPGVGVHGMRDELLAACQDLERQALAASEGRGGAIDQQPLRGAADAQAGRVAQHGGGELGDLDGQRAVQDVDVDADHGAGGDADAAARPAPPDVHLEGLRRPVAMPGPVGIGRPFRR